MAAPRTAGVYAWSTSAHLVHPYNLLGQQHSSKNPVVFFFFHVHDEFLEVDMFPDTQTSEFSGRLVSKSGTTIPIKRSQRKH